MLDDPAQKIYSVIYYNEKTQPAQVVSSNHLYKRMNKKDEF